MSNPKHPKNTRLYLAGIFLILLAAIVFGQQAFNTGFIPASRPDQIFLLYSLSTLIFVVLLVFTFILLRTVVKVWIERKQGKPGARFKTSLLAMLVALTLVPAISVFAYAYGLVNRSIDKWFSVPVDQIFQKTTEIDQLAQDREKEEAQRILEFLSTSLPEDFARTRQLLGLKGMVLLKADGSVARESLDSGLQPSTLHSRVLKALGRERNAFEAQDGDWLGVRRIQTADGEESIFAAVFPARRDIAALSAEIASEKVAYDQLKAEKILYRDGIYRAILLLMTILIMFAAVWMGLFLSKRVTEPIEALAAGTREISAGNLSYRIHSDASYELGMLVSLFNDMASQLQETTAELETRRRYMEIILESIPTGVISLDADLRIHTLNRAARAMLSAATGTSLEDVFAGEDLDTIKALLSEATPNGHTEEISFQTPGRPTHSAVTTSRLTTGGYVLVIEDLTEVVRAHRASAWRDVARRLAHEIRNPLTPIQLSAERIARNVGRLPGAAPKVSTVVQECVGAIVDEVASLKHLVDEFVRFARLPNVERIPQSLRELVERTLALYEGRIDGVQLQLDLPAELPLVLMDSLQMRRVLINLIDNALEAMSGQKERTLNIRCTLARDETMARLTIEDNGGGILPADRERLFTPYFTTRKDGTGLGLSIASRIVADHGGYIGAEPNLPRGTRFIIELPVCQESSLSMTNRVSGSR